MRELHGALGGCKQGASAPNPFVSRMEAWFGRSCNGLGLHMGLGLMSEDLITSAAFCKGIDIRIPIN